MDETDEIEAPVDMPRVVRRIATLLIERTGLPAQTVSATLMKLEMRRLVQALPGFRYVKR